ncbi:hypothetical protein AB6A40_011460 [Gnathostoma spinigerum]|uniref:Tc1-like transposase DDE domain-containing protein n=1 Tax=Gnathostoma spinigerum TaxID=75299 RepID=A0ABD6EZB1_9BILA
MGCRSHISRSGEGCSWMTLETKDSSSQTDDPRHTDVGTQCSMLTTTSNLPSLPPLPRSSRLCPKCRCLIARVHEIRKLQDIDGDNLSSTAANLGVSRRTVRLCLERYGPIYRYQADRVRSGEVPSPANKLPACRKSKRCLNRRELCNQVRNSIPIFVQQKLREVMHSFYKQNLPPTLASVLTIMRGCLGEDFDYGKEHLRMLLRGIGFKFQVAGDQAICFERTDICRWRGRYVRRMAQLRAEGYSLFFSDETWLFEGMQLARQWVDTVTAANPLQSLSEGLTAGPSRAPSKGKRVVIIHTMGEDGFVDGALKFIISGRSVADGDYHGEMNAETFEAYLKAILPLLKKSREDKVALIIDNAPYHSRKETRERGKKGDSIPKNSRGKIPEKGKERRLDEVVSMEQCVQ